MGSQSYRDLEVWKRSAMLVTEIYRTTATFPSEERFGLTSQLRRAAVSVPSNIAEGQARLHRGDFVHHLSMARGSMAEIETLVFLAKQLGFLSDGDSPDLELRIDEIQRMLHGLIASLSSPTMHNR